MVTLLDSLNTLQSHKVAIGNAVAKGDYNLADKLARIVWLTYVVRPDVPLAKDPSTLSLAESLLNFYDAITSDKTCSFQDAKKVLGIDDLVFDVLHASGVIKTIGEGMVKVKRLHMYAAFIDGKGYVHQLADSLVAKALGANAGAEAQHNYTVVFRKVMATAEKYIDSLVFLGLADVVGVRNGPHLLVYPLRKEKELVELFEGWAADFAKRESSQSLPLAKSA